MKKIYYLLLMIFGLSIVTQSCKKMEDEDGDLLNNYGANEGGLNGPRYLAYELGNGDSTLAIYRYNGLKLNLVVNGKNVKNITYNGDMINKIDFYGKQATDSIRYTQYFTYNNAGKITSIAETRSQYDSLGVNTKNFKTLYNMYYSSTSGKVDSITMRKGQQLSGQTFAYNQYAISKIDYYAPGTAYIGNVQKMKKSEGEIDAAGNFGPILQEFEYSFDSYDDKISPYGLLPFGYNLHNLLESELGVYHLSPNNPRVFTISGDTLPAPITQSTMYTYDPQKYALTGFFGTNYVYAPF